MTTPLSEVPKQKQLIKSLEDFLDEEDCINPDNVKDLFRGFIQSDIMDAMTAIQRADIYRDFERLQELTKIVNSYWDSNPPQQ